MTGGWKWESSQCETGGQSVHDLAGHHHTKSHLHGEEGIERGNNALKAPAGEISRQLFSSHRGAIAAGLHGYNGVLVGLLMAVFSAKGDYHWWLLLPVALVSMMW